jgi:hypothetical protein
MRAEKSLRPAPGDNLDHDAADRELTEHQAQLRFALERVNVVASLLSRKDAVVVLNRALREAIDDLAAEQRAKGWRG